MSKIILPITIIRNKTKYTNEIYNYTGALMTKEVEILKNVFKKLNKNNLLKKLYFK